MSEIDPQRASAERVQQLELLRAKLGEQATAALSGVGEVRLDDMGWLRTFAERLQELAEQCAKAADLAQNILAEQTVAAHPQAAMEPTLGREPTV